MRGPRQACVRAICEVTVCRSFDTPSICPQVFNKMAASPQKQRTGPGWGGLCRRQATWALPGLSPRPRWHTALATACLRPSQFGVQLVKAPRLRTGDPAGSWSATCEAQGRLAGPPLVANTGHTDLQVSGWRALCSAGMPSDTSPKGTTPPRARGLAASGQLGGHLAL